MSFGFKLLLGILALVGVTTAATLYLTRSLVSGAYEDFLADQFSHEVARFYEREAAEFEAVTRNVEGATNSVRLIAALGEVGHRFDDPALRERVYTDLKYEVRNLLNRDSLVRFIYHDGRVIQPVEAGAGTYPAVEGAAMNDELSELGEHFEELNGPEMGYINLPAGGQWHFFRVVLAPVVDAVWGEFFGAIAMVFPLSEEENSSDHRILRGLLVGEHLYSGDIPSSLEKSLLRLRDLSNTGERRIRVGGTSYLPFFNQVETGPGFPPVSHVSLFSLAGTEALLEEATWTIVGVGVVAMMAAVVVSFGLSQRVSRPVRELERSAREVEGGNFSVTVPVRGKDELGRLSRAFNSMTEGLALKERYRDVLEKVTDREVAEELMHGDIVLGGETRFITVLFCDLRSFTPFTENLEPQEVIEMLNEHMTAMTAVVRAHNGVVDKFVGDEIMVLFGAPRSYGNDALNAGRCALAMIEERRRLNREGRWNIDLGIGLAAGEMVAGRMGSMDRLNYTVLGARVNLAARLCSAAAPMEAVTDSATVEAIGDAIDFESRQPAHLKGFTASFHVYSLKSINVPS